MLHTYNLEAEIITELLNNLLFSGDCHLVVSLMILTYNFKKLNV